MGTTTNIVVGMQSDNTLKIGSYGDSETTAVDAGFIKGGITVEHSETQHEIKVDQVLGTIDRVPTDESMKIKMSLAEASLANLACAFGYPASAVSSGTLVFGGKDTSPAKTLYINVKGPSGGNRKYTFWKCVPSGKTSQTYKRDGETVVDVEFQVLTDATKTQGQRFGQIVDSGTDTTAPTVAMTTPISGGTTASGASGTITLTFTESGKMDENTIVYGDTIQILKEGSGTTVSSLVAGSGVFDRSAKTYTFTPTSSWSAGRYTVMVSCGVKDMSGNRLTAPFYGYFTAA